MGFVDTSLVHYFLFLLFLAVVMAVMFWALARQERRRRAAFLAQFDVAELRMDPHRLGLVYRVVLQETDAITVTPVWNDKQPVAAGKTFAVRPDQVVPFDPARFFS